MDRQEALHSLLSGGPQARREAARVLAVSAKPTDLPAIQAAYRDEQVWYVRSNLRRAILKLTGDFYSDRKNGTRTPDYSEAVRNVTKQLVHEVRQYMSRLSLHTRRLSSSGVNVAALSGELERLNDFLEALLKLGDVAAPASIEEFDLSAQIQRHTGDEIALTDYPVSLAGTIPFLCFGDRRLVALIYCNALRNAIEASMQVESRPPIVVSWGDSDVDYWLSVADSGTGLPPDLSRIYDVGKTTKRAHLGMGLTIAMQASESLDGSINLVPREIGTLFEFRWPKGRA